MDIQSESWKKDSEAHTKVYSNYLKKAKVKQVLKQLPSLHEEAFEKINCLECAACCKNYSPRFKPPDIKRISKYVGMREPDFIMQYLRIDVDGDYVVKQKPCPFLGENNLCSIYDHRPSDCSRFPYTDEDVLIKRPAITLKNVSFCPAVFYVLEALTKAKP